VCRFVDSSGTVFGTGFLVSPEYVMTAAHVLFGEDGKPRRAASDISVEFETVLIHPKVIVQTNTPAILLAAAWAVDPVLINGVADREIASLDYAIVKLAKAAGDDLVEQPNTKRGWIEILKTPPYLNAELMLHLIQYVDRKSVNHSVGRVVALSADGMRVSYAASTLDGASGAPVLSDEFELAALHVTGFTSEEQFNSGIPIRKIKASLDTRGIVLPPL
jgi:V8-like Glu-specific endopeptidase